MKAPFLLCLLTPALAFAQPATMQQQFRTPPNAAKPRVWWHWMNGNITKEGIKKDLDWMSRVGIGGFQNFDASLFTPVVVPKKLVFMTPDWKDAFHYATDVARTNQLEMAIAGSPGWSVTGGPWVPASDAMKKYVWSEMQVTGGQPFTGKLPTPPATTGSFQQVPIAVQGMTGGTTQALPTYYQDAALIAYRLPADDQPFTQLNPRVSSSGGTFDLKALTDGDVHKATYLPPTAVGESMWIQYEFDKPQTFRAFSIAGANHTALEQFNGGPENRALSVSDDGVTFRPVATIPGSIVPQNTRRIPPTTARFFRFTFVTLKPEVNRFAAMAGQTEAPKPEGVNVAELMLYSTDRIDLFEDKAGFTPWVETGPGMESAVAGAIPLADIVDLTRYMKADGSLNWTPPAGTWQLVRLGYSLTGRQNHPASPEATGLEVDKLDKDAVRRYINTYLDMYSDATGGKLGTAGLQYMILDSYEAGHMTWTKALPDEFRKRRGYSLIPWIPVLTGRVVKSYTASEGFLWDFRKTIGELIAENHYDQIGDVLHQRGMKRYTESHENKRIFLADGMDVKRNADIPMSAMWTPGSLAGGGEEEIRSKADIRESASVAHIYGQNLVAAESMTSIGNAFSYDPQRLKRTADMELASGLNRFVIHTSVHQPLDDKKPGFSLGPFGQYFTRQETWAEQAKPWMTYLGRSCYLLQQGKPVVDVLYYYGENKNITSLFTTKLADVSPGYEYDFVNATALLNVVRAEKGKLVVPSGLTYQLLVLDESARQMTLPVLRKIGELIKAGVPVAGVKPEQSPSLSDDPATFRTLVDQLWRSPNVTVGKPVAEVLKALRVPEDVLVRQEKAPVLFVHRQTATESIYWLNSRSDEPNDAEVSFRIAGRVPMLWHPQTGKIESVSYRIVDGRTVIPLHFDSWDAYFVVFGEPTTTTSFTRPARTETRVASLTTPWRVQFPTASGNPRLLTFDKLTSWTDHADAAVSYFSGTATYQTSFAVPDVVKNGQYVLDLGEVKNLAEVIVNGKNVGIAWKKPFRLDISEAVKAGDNQLEIRVTNLWPNRLIGDAQPGAVKTTFTTMPFYQATSPLLPSGLLGPVQVVVSTTN
ncbi:F5/8 type C domain-containing protein [Spirosoma oryzae]|uniref:F5/8 type C domain-containing protein n=1 Tax=Spirosoma oryzae TaxID=1469603 RepID=A0A2T0SQ15_9BACT|nr:glycosyl hydrolase [Spirosoma oryzae]PRY35504.1 F5/8 type C domain-containing protein [Spirosoma oryzae]